MTAAAQLPVDTRRRAGCGIGVGDLVVGCICGRGRSIVGLCGGGVSVNVINDDTELHAVHGFVGLSGLVLFAHLDSSLASVVARGSNTEILRTATTRNMAMNANTRQASRP